MSGFLDIYIKLIIAIISFITPLTVYLLSVFWEGTAILTRKAREYEIQIATLLSAQMQDLANGQNFDPTIISSSGKLLRENEKMYTKRLRLLNPAVQLKRIFIPFLLALLFIMADMIIKDPSFGWYDKDLSLGLIFLSIVSFIVGMTFLEEVSTEIIRTKQMIANDKSAISVKPVGE